MAKAKFSRRMLTTARKYPDNFEDYGHVIPSIVGLSKVLGVNRRALYRWRDADKDGKNFAPVLDDVMAAQEFTLLDKGLRGDINSNIAKLALGKHGYTDNKNHISKDGSMSPKPTEIKLVAPNVGG